MTLGTCASSSRLLPFFSSVPCFSSAVFCSWSWRGGRGPGRKDVGSRDRLHVLVRGTILTQGLFPTDRPYYGKGRNEGELRGVLTMVPLVERSPVSVLDLGSRSSDSLSRPSRTPLVSDLRGSSTTVPSGLPTPVLRSGRSVLSRHQNAPRRSEGSFVVSKIVFFFIVSLCIKDRN